MAAITRFRPLLNRVLVGRASAATETAGGIIIPDQYQSKVNEGEVLAVGPGARDKDGGLIPMGVSVGDKVLLPEYGGQAIKLDGEELHLFREDDILGVMEN